MARCRWEATLFPVLCRFDRCGLVHLPSHAIHLGAHEVARHDDVHG